MKIVSLLTRLVFLASVNLLAISYLAAQSDSGPPPAAALNASSATIDFGADTISEPRKKDSIFAEVALEPAQTVIITLQYDPALSGQAVNVETLDGGQITAQDQGLVIGQDGVLRFQFQAGGRSRAVSHPCSSRRRRRYSPVLGD